MHLLSLLYLQHYLFTRPIFRLLLEIYPVLSMFFSGMLYIHVYQKFYYRLMQTSFLRTCKGGARHFFVVHKSQICKFLGTFRYCKSTHFLGLPICKVNPQICLINLPIENRKISDGCKSPNRKFFNIGLSPFFMAKPPESVCRFGRCHFFKKNF